MAESQLTDWERRQIKAIDKLIQKSQLTYLAFDREQRLLNTRTIHLLPDSLQKRMSQRLQCFATDLSSALEHLSRLKPDDFSQEDEKLDTLRYLRNNTVQGNQIYISVENNAPGYFITLPVGSGELETERVALTIILPRLLNFVIDTRDKLVKMAFPGQVTEYIHVDWGLDDRVKIDQDGNTIRMIWEEFDEQYGIYNVNDS